MGAKLPLTSTTISNIAVTIACLVLAILGGLRIKDEFNPPNGPPSQVTPATVDDSTFSIAGAESRGQQNAKAVIVEFSDFECPFCARHASDTFDAIKTEFVDTGKVRYVVMHLPFESHLSAQKAAEAAECAGLQGGFWPMRQRLFTNQRALDESSLIQYASGLGLDAGSFTDCLDDGAMSRKVKAQSEMAKALQIRNTPVFVLGTIVGSDQVKAIRRVVGAHPIEIFRTVLKEITSS